MPAAKERFSIRNYAATMRIAAVDPALCRPFSRFGHENSPLPPIPVRRYRWWADELDDVSPAAEFSLEIPSVSREIPPKNVITTSKMSELPSKRSAEEDFRSLKGRPKRKIRTMAELIASSSQIEDVKELVEAAPEEEKKAARTRKGKPKERREGLMLNEKNVCKSKMMSSTYIHSLREPTHKKNFRKNAADGAVERQKFEQVMRTLQKGAESIKCRQRRRTTHVTFSGKDDILGGSKRRSSTMLDHPQIKNPCQILISSCDSSAANNSSTNHKADINATAIDITVASSSKKNPAIDSHNDTGYPALETSRKEAPLAVMIDLNQAVETNSDDNFWGTAHKEISINSTEINQESGLTNTPTITPTERDYHSPHGDEHLFINTPLNSQGAVVQIHPEMNMASGSDHNVFSAQRDVESNIEVNHLEIKSKKVFYAGSYQRDHQSEWCSNQYHHELNFTEITDSGSSSVQNRELIEDEDGFLRCSDSNRRKPSLPDYAIPDSLKNAFLMSRNAEVDGSNRYCHACGGSRTDKDCRMWESLFSITPENNIPKHWTQPARPDSPSNYYDWEPRLSRNRDESVGNYNSEASVGIKHQYPTIESYERSIGQPVMSGSTNSKHKSAAFEPQIRESLKSLRLKTSAALPHWLLLHAKCSPYSAPAQISALAPSSSQSSSIFTGTNSNF